MLPHSIHIVNCEICEKSNTTALLPATPYPYTHYMWYHAPLVPPIYGGLYGGAYIRAL